MLKLLLDSRESKLISCINDRNLENYSEKMIIETQQMDIGDIHIVNNSKTWIIERKTVSDLLSSLKDGRYKEQKTRLLASSCDITYIIEGDDIISNRNQRNQDLLSSIYMFTMYRDNIHLVFTKDIEDTATFILTLCIKMIDKTDKFLLRVDGVQPDYVDCIKMKKINNITPEICYIMQLSQIPTISATIAKYIQAKYHTMYELLKALHESDDKISLLCRIEKVGKEKANKILQYLNL